MKKGLIYYIRFYFYSYLFFIQGLRYPDKYNKNVEIQVVTENRINLLDDGDEVIMEKPSQAEAMANQARLALSSISKDTKKKLLIVISLLIYFLGCGIISTVFFIINSVIKYHIIGWLFLAVVLLYFSYVIIKSIYTYLKQKKYKAVLFKITNTWTLAKDRAYEKLHKPSAC